MKTNHVAGKKTRDILIYALSTCVWCGKTKKFMSELGVDYSYVDVDLLDEEEKEKVKGEIMKWNPDCSFPTIVIDKKSCIVGFKPEYIKREVFSDAVT